ncbi:tRNA nucleotidyltransferase [Sodiomyces alkalinus F11]|uniref:tRNA nucleotidyltransferase n=1 Tax=Sodiomyces alkalinus (strain CBS 110278 / VKM F-3762 / F11) TaxID=1314773 RepID=A0A3N2Q4T6_SODAK|nr:tRNA nucleotidyltransferase [Sodiomyces alkalinus F11]ROT41784.1 tRNA nucleotidyltransferase [Sodiomyces alkalinus F11]
MTLQTYSVMMKRTFADFVSQPHIKTPASSNHIELTTREAQLRDLLLDVAASINSTHNPPEPLTLRWAGGWVRDKLLGIESHDIDVAINSMTGLTFGEKMREYCATPSHASRHGIRPDDIGNLHKIAANPEKSKNLETTTVKILDFDVDFVNLRTESYTDDSRNPVVQFGTAQEDAFRRDATVNALFYNLHTTQVEDFTGGLADMRAKLIRTPLEPLQTFTDDPLRVLRLVRFASRLGFSIDPATRVAMSDAKVLRALKVKISRERVGVELEKMLRGNTPCRALELLDDMGLYQAIYTDPTRDDLPAPDLSRWRVAYRLLDTLSHDTSSGSIYTLLVQSAEDKYNAWVLAALTPWALTSDPPTPTGPGKTKAPLPYAAIVAREGTKVPNKLFDVIVAARRHWCEIRDTKESICVGLEAKRNPQRDTIGMAIRKWDARESHWRLQALYTILVDVMNRVDAVAANEIDGLLSEWQMFLDYLEDEDLMDVTSLARLVDGKMIARELRVKPGEWVGRALDVCLSWQLRNPGFTDPKGAIEETRSIDTV